ncbi:MAG: hypothetical protein AB1716_19780 [Planctomycetota bacterium]
MVRLRVGAERRRPPPPPFVPRRSLPRAKFPKPKQNQNPPGRQVMPKLSWILLSTASLGFCAGCLEDAEKSLLTAVLENAQQRSAAGTGIEGLESAPANLTATELTALHDLLAALPQNATELLPGLLDGTPSLTDLKQLGYSRRDIALLALDVLAAQQDLTADQEHALRFTRALLSRDRAALAEFVLEQVLQGLTGATVGQNNGGST